MNEIKYLTIYKRQTIIDSLSQILPSLNDLSDEDFEKVVKSIAIDNLKEELKKEHKKSNFNLKDCIQTFLNRCQSKHTKRTYKTCITIFTKWMDKNNLNPIDISVMQADKFVCYINSLDKSNNYKALILSVVSSFYSYLFRWDLVNKQPFLRCDRPKVSKYNKSTDKVPSLYDIQNMFLQIDKKIENKNKNISLGGKKIKLSVLILLNNGLRVGSLNTMVIKQDGSYICETKGKTQTGKLDSISFDYLKTTFSFKEGNLSKILTSNTLLNFFKRNHFSFSSHSLRHYFSITHYTKNKDIYKLSRLLNHNNIGITGTYLSSLDLNIA